MLRPMLLALLLVALPLAGCLGAEAPEAAPGADVPDPASFVLDYAAAGCVEAAVAFLVPHEQAAALLPPGFVPSDAQDFFGLPARADRAVLYAYAQTCDTWGFDGTYRGAAVSVVVEQPAVEATLEPAYDFYELASWGASSEYAAHFARVGWPVDVGEATVSMDALPQGATAQGEVRDEAGSVLRFELAAPATQPLDGIGRFWKAVPGGIAYFEHHISTTLAAGGVTCTISGAVAEAVGATSCQESEAVGMALLPFDYEAKLRFLPDAGLE